MRQIKFYILSMLLLLLTSCYNHGQRTPDAWDLTQHQLDSISFSTTHHYTQNYNFVVTTKSLPLSDNLPDMAFDSLYVVRGERIVVAEIQIVPTDSVDSVWVKVARDQVTQGWIRESELLKGVSPDDPISQFIDIFSDTHLLIFMAFCVIVGGAYAMRWLLRRKAPIATSTRSIPLCYAYSLLLRLHFMRQSRCSGLSLGVISTTTLRSILLPCRCIWVFSFRRSGPSSSLDSLR